MHLAIILLNDTSTVIDGQTLTSDDATREFHSLAGEYFEYAGDRAILANLKETVSVDALAGADWSTDYGTIIDSVHYVDPASILD